jgi:ABC-type sulfate transport system permease component
MTGYHKLIRYYVNAGITGLSRPIISGDMITWLDRAIGILGDLINIAGAMIEHIK